MLLATLVFTVVEIISIKTTQRRLQAIHLYPSSLVVNRMPCYLLLTCYKDCQFTIKPTQDNSGSRQK